MRRADQFIELYNRLTNHLAKITNTGVGGSFYDLLTAAANTNSVVERELIQLQNYGRLRNIIVHHSGYPREIIAEPSEETIARFRRIIDRIISPRKLSDFIRQTQVFTVEDRLSVALQYMGANDFSQVVVRKDNKLALLTAEGVARWLEKQVQQELIAISESTIGEALACDIPNTFKLMGRDGNIEEVASLFTKSLEHDSPRLFAIIITQSGKPNENPLGIITPWDLIELG